MEWFTDSCPPAAHTQTPAFSRGGKAGFPPLAAMGTDLPRWAAPSLETLTLSAAEVLLVLDGIGQRSHHLLLLQRQDAQALYQARQPVSSPFALSVLV